MEQLFCWRGYYGQTLYVRAAPCGLATLPLVTSLVLITTFMLGFYWRDMVRGAMCTGAVDEHCTREWISALGGWIAIVFAYLTIRTMTRQTEDANRHQSENIELQILDKLTIARRAVDQATYAMDRCTELIDKISLRRDENNFRQFSIADEIDDIIQACTPEDMLLVSTVATGIRYDPIVAMKSARELIPDLNFHAYGGQRDEEAIAIADDILQEMGYARERYFDIINDGKLFIEYWKTRAGKK